MRHLFRPAMLVMAGLLAAGGTTAVLAASSGQPDIPAIEISAEDELIRRDDLPDDQLVRPLDDDDDDSDDSTDDSLSDDSTDDVLGIDDDSTDDDFGINDDSDDSSDDSISDDSDDTNSVDDSDDTND